MTHFVWGMEELHVDEVVKVLMEFALDNGRDIEVGRKLDRFGIVFIKTDDKTGIDLKQVLSVSENRKISATTELSRFI